MLNNGQKKCDLADEIVSYLYDEAAPAERDRFESHIAECQLCTDEFAAISNVRFSIFEWQKEKFASLPTPKFIVPCPDGIGIGSHSSIAFLAGLREMLVSWTAIPVAAALLLVLGFVFMAIRYNSVSSTDVVVANVEDRLIPELPSAEQPPVSKVQILDPFTDIKPPGNTREARIASAKVLDKRSPHDPGAFVPKLKNDVAITLPEQKPKKAPALTGYEDEDDNSLRLSDLFDEVGSKL